MKTSTPIRLTLLATLSLSALLLLFHTSGGRFASASNKGAPRKVAAQTSTDPSVIGRWELQPSGTTVDNSWNNSPLPIHISLLPNGKLLFWGRDKRTVGSEIYDDQGYTTASIWDPFYKTFTPADLKGPTPETLRTKTNLFCSGHSFLPDGRLFVTGGHNIHEPYPLSEGMGSIHTNIFDYKNNTWTRGPDMNNGRWYPYNLTLASGETLVVAGTYLNEPVVGRPTTSKNDVAQIYGVQGSLRDVSKLQDFNLSVVSNYPLLHLLSDGRALVATSGSDKRSYVLSPSPFSGQGTWTHEGQLNLPHDRSTAVLYQKDKVLLPGGSNGRFIQNQTEVYEKDVNGLPSWRMISSMTYPRIYHTSTILPDGQVLVTGGTTCEGSNGIDCPGGAAKTPELWNPANEAWSSMASHQEARVYHSTAILLPDARVLVGGGGRPAAQGERMPNGEDCLSATATVPSSPQCRAFGHNNVEIFSPPYLFLPNNGGAAPRPAITSAPKEMTYGQNFSVGVGTVSAQEIESAALIRLGSVTHGFNQDQRRVALTVTSRAADGRSLNLSAPSSAADCPPGYYMLFLMKRNGANLTPSVAKIVRVNKVSTPATIQAIQGKGESRSLAVSATAGTNWTATVTGGNHFISISSPTGTATGTGTLSYSVAVNTTGAPRSGTITISVPGQPVFNQVISIYQGKQFDDVPSAGVEDTPSKLSALLITSGCSATGFCPNSAIRRDELAIFFVRAAHDVGVLPPTPSTVTFPNDVPPNYWAYTYIEDFYKRGFTDGCGAGSFCPANNVSRNELAVFLVRALGIDPPATQRQTFQDVPTSSPYHRFIEEAFARGFLPECGTAPPPPQSGDAIWVEDSLPAGAIGVGESEGWNWVAANPSPFSGSLSHQSNPVAGLHQHYFYGATGTNALTVNAGDKLYAYVYLDPMNPPSEVMLQWNDGTWEHRAYWGANQIGYGTDGTASRRYMGPRPALGQWVRLEVPASDVGLEGKTLQGMAFTLYGGLATWDRAGKTSETVWVEDSLPAGATPFGESEGWNWVGANPSPFSGSLSHQSNLVAGPHQHYFLGATNRLSINSGDKLFAYVYLDPMNPPTEIMLQWAENDWEHRAYWGANQIGYGINGTASRRYMGPLPPAGRWVRLEVPAGSVGLEGRSLQGMAFTLYGGRATWDRAGKVSAATSGSSLTFCPANLVTRREVATGLVRAYGH